MRLSYRKYSIRHGVQRVKTKTGLVVMATGLALSGGGLSLAYFGSVNAQSQPWHWPQHQTVSTVVVRQADLDNTSSSPTVVRSDGLNKWFMYNDTTDAVDNTLGNFVYGPTTPPNGQGSVEFTLGGSPNDRKNIATYQFKGTKLADITDLSFVAYSHSGVAGPNESPYLNFNVDFNGSDTWQKRLVYVPSANGAVPQDRWNTFDAIDGGNALWTWSGYASNGNKWPDGNISEYRTWNDIMDAFPSADILSSDSWLGVRVGEPGPASYTGAIDAVTFGTASHRTTYDFEPAKITVPGDNLQASQCDLTRQSKEVVDVSYRLVNDYDSAVHGNAWANDTINRDLNIWQVSTGNYCAIVKDNGNFVTFAGDSANGTDTVDDGVLGQIDGGYRTTNFTGAFIGSVNYHTHGYLGTFDLGCTGTAPGYDATCTGARPSYLSYFSSTSGDSLDWWGWEYDTCQNGSWINSVDANIGDITGDAPAGKDKNCHGGNNKHMHDHDHFVGAGYFWRGNYFHDGPRI